MSSAVDLVYTWVDGSHPSHFFTRMRYRLKERVTSDNTWVRWADRDELRYSLRSVEKNAAFFRRIFIVCMDGQRPPWLSNDERVTVVHHSEFMPPGVLPTFSSTVIESFLYRIPGLAENFVYSNDDFMFLRKVERATFFEGEKPIVYLGPHLCAQGEVQPADNGHKAGVKNANELLNRRFGAGDRLQAFHYPQSLSKAACEIAWQNFPNELLNAANSKFRSAANIAFTNCLAPHLMLHANLGVRRNAGDIGIMIGFRNVRLMNLLASCLKYGFRLPEARAKAQIAAQPQGKLLVIVADRTTIRKILQPLFPEPSAFEV